VSVLGIMGVTVLEGSFFVSCVASILLRRFILPFAFAAFTFLGLGLRLRGFKFFVFRF
jgi:hypothetical protein